MEGGRRRGEGPRPLDWPPHCLTKTLQPPAHNRGVGEAPPCLRVTFHISGLWPPPWGPRNREHPS